MYDFVEKNLSESARPLTYILYAYTRECTGNGAENNTETIWWVESSLSKKKHVTKVNLPGLCISSACIREYI